MIKIIKKRFIPLLMAICVITNITSAYATETKVKEDNEFSESANVRSTSTFTLGSSGGTVSFYDSAYIAINNVSPFSTITVKLSGNSGTEYQVWYRNTDTFKYIYANGSSCSKYTVVGGTMYIQINPYNGTNGWVTATITT